MLTRGRLNVLALFDKPDPLEGPFFEETIYVTPSRLPEEIQGAVAAATARAVHALGLQEGPIHAELRVNEDGPVIVEVAARSIGGLCSRVLRFGVGARLEDLILQHALGLPIESLEREARPAGVMMIPIPRAGRLQHVHGLQRARKVVFSHDAHRVLNSNTWLQHKLLIRHFSEHESQHADHHSNDAIRARQFSGL